MNGPSPGDSTRSEQREGRDRSNSLDRVVANLVTTAWNHPTAASDSTEQDAMDVIVQFLGRRDVRNRLLDYLEGFSTSGDDSTDGESFRGNGSVASGRSRSPGAASEEEHNVPVSTSQLLDRATPQMGNHDMNAPAVKQQGLRSVGPGPTYIATPTDATFDEDVVLDPGPLQELIESTKWHDDFKYSKWYALCREGHRDGPSRLVGVTIPNQPGHYTAYVRLQPDNERLGRLELGFHPRKSAQREWSSGLAVVNGAASTSASSSEGTGKRKEVVQPPSGELASYDLPDYVEDFDQPEFFEDDSREAQRDVLATLPQPQSPAVATATVPSVPFVAVPAFMRGVVPYTSLAGNHPRDDSSSHVASPGSARIIGPPIVPKSRLPASAPGSARAPSRGLPSLDNARVLDAHGHYAIQPLAFTGRSNGFSATIASAYRISATQNENLVGPVAGHLESQIFDSVDKSPAYTSDSGATGFNSPGGSYTSLSPLITNSLQQPQPSYGYTPLSQTGHPEALLHPAHRRNASGVIDPGIPRPSTVSGAPWPDALSSDHRRTVSSSSETRAARFYGPYPGFEPTARYTSDLGIGPSRKRPRTDGEEDAPAQLVPDLRNLRDRRDFETESEPDFGVYDDLEGDETEAELATRAGAASVTDPDIEAEDSISLASFDEETDADKGTNSEGDAADGIEGLPGLVLETEENFTVDRNFGASDVHQAHDAFAALGSLAALTPPSL